MKKLIAIFGLMALAACGGDDEAAVEGAEGVDANATTTTTADTFVNKDTTMAPVVTPVVTSDTGVVQTTTTVDVDKSVDVDTVRRP